MRALNANADAPQRVAEVLLELLTSEVALEGAAVATVHDGGFEVLRAIGTLGPLTGETVAVDGSFAAAAVAQRRTLVYEGEALAALDPHFRERFGVKHGVVAPLVAGDTPVGVLVAINPSNGSFLPADLAVISRLAVLGSLPIQNAWLLGRERQRSREASALAAIAQELNQSLELERVTTLVADKCVELLGAEGAALTLFDGANVLPAAISGVASLFTSQAGSLAERVTRRVAETRRAVRIPDVHQPRSDGSEPARASCMAAPLLLADRPVGALMVVASPDRDFSDREEELLFALASHGAVAIQNATRYRAAAHTARRAETLSSVAQSLSRAVDATSFFDALSRVAHDVLGASGLTVYSIAQGSNTVRIAYMAGVAADALARAATMAMAHPDVVRPIVEGVEDFFEDLRSERARPFWNAAPDARIPDELASLARLPLVVEGRLRGALSLRWRYRQSFPEDERVLLRDFAAQVALALRNAEQFEAERHSREVAEAAALIARGALVASSARHVAEIALDAIDRAVPSPGKAIAFVDSSRTRLRYLAASGTLAPLVDTTPTLAESAASLSSSYGNQRIETPLLAGLAEGAIVAPGTYLIPLLARDQLLGVLWASTGPSADNDDAAFDTLRNLAASLALAADVLLLNEEEQKRRAREHMLATALATMDQAVLIVGLDGRVLYANAAAIAEYGYPFDSVQDIPFDRLVDAAAVAKRVGAEPAPGTGGTVWEAEHMHRRRDGTTFPASVLLSHIRDADGVPVGQVVTVRNLSAEQRIEEQLRQSEKLAALGELVAGVAHELNNPLAGISAFAQLLMEDPLGEEQQESVRLIKREADRAVGVIRDLLLFSRKTGPTQASVNVNEMVELTLRLRGYGLRSAGIDVRLELDADLPMVAGDSQRLQQVLLNLIINAEYALQRAEPKRLVVRSERTREGVAIVVADSGVGMDEATRQRIFEPFFTTKPAGDGTGLGLSVSYGIIRAHGGFITVESAPGQGTRFRVELPAARDPGALASA